MLVDLIVGVVIVAAVAWGYRRGFQSMLAPAGFAAGVVLGTRIPPLLGVDLQSAFSLVIALPAALVLGGLCAAMVERYAHRLRRRLRRRALARAAGALLGGAVGAVATWALSPIATQVDFLHDPLERSTVLARLNSVLPPAGPEPRGKILPPLENFPTIPGRAPDVAAADPRAETDPDVLAAERSIVKVGVRACGHGGLGSGWIVADGIVVTNAHVVAAADTITARARGAGYAHASTPIWYDPVNDVALLRVPELRGVPPLRMVKRERPKIGTSGASLGFPGGVKDIRAARLGPTTSRKRGRMGGRPAGPGFPRELFGRLVTLFRGGAEPGSSGGPVVDRRGRVLTTVFGGQPMTGLGAGVPNRFVRAAVREAGPAVSTGPCADHTDRARRR